MSATIITGRDALALALDASGVRVTRTTPSGIREHASNLFQSLRSGEPSVVVIEADGVTSLDVLALRWMFPAGVTPLVLIPSTPEECSEIGELASAAATLVPGPVFVLLENPVADAEADFDAAPAPELSVIDPPPSDMTELGEEEAELRTLEARWRAPIKGLSPVRLDANPPEQGKPEWLVLSYGLTSLAAEEAVAHARADGQRVNHLRLRQLWPLPEAEILRALMGIKHVVMAERNLGQYGNEIRRIAPEMPIVPATRATGPVEASQILQRLQRTPRCC